MAAIRQNARWLSATGLLLGAAFVVWWWVLPRPATGEPPAAAAAALPLLQTYEPLDAVAAGQIDELRRENALDDDTLAALDLSSSELETVLASARTWYETNVAKWVSRRSAVADQRALIRKFLSDINNGIDRSAELSAARQQLPLLEADREALAVLLRQTTGAGLSQGQRTLADGMRARRSSPMPYRVLTLTAEQDRALRRALNRYRQRISVTRSAQTRSTIRADFDQELAAGIGAVNLQTLATLRTYRGSASERVTAAVQLVLPGGGQG